MRPLDPRLLRRARASRTFLAIGGLIAVVQTCATIVFAWCVAQALTRAIDGAPLAEVAPLLGVVAAAVIVRACCLWATDAAAAAASARVKAELRAAAVQAVVTLGPDGMAGRNSARVASMLGTGLDALDNYFGRYLPQLLLTALATPLLVLVMLLQDPLSGLIVVIALPLIPVFMVLIGWATQAAQKRSWSTLQTLSAAFLDVVGGLGTLKIFGRQYRQAPRIAAVTDQYRGETMKVLRISFLSGFVLELAASLSVAVVAVEVGLRLLDGGLLLGVGLFVLLLAPEAFLPIRGVGVQFHAAADGLAAAEDVLGLLDEADVAAARSTERGDASARSGAESASAHGRGGLQLEALTVRHGEHVVIDGLTAQFAPASVTVITGPSGVGKSSLLGAIAGLGAFEGVVLLDGRPLARSLIAWTGQRPGLVAGTVAENVGLGDQHPDAGAVRRALRAAAIEELDPDLMLGAAGAGLSGGQAQRVSIARAMHRLETKGCAVLLLDEPTSALDAASEERVVATLRAVALRGAAVVVVSHRPAVIAAADAVLAIEEVARV